MKKLRESISNQRQSLNASEIAQASLAMCHNLSTLPIIQTANTIAAYMAYQGEISPITLIETLSPEKAFYLPVLHSDHPSGMCFVRYQPGDPLTKNAFDIVEPAYNKNTIIEAHALDIVLAPLLAFDSKGMRLGTGGGYYDKTFAFLAKTPKPAKPILIGLAYEFQRQENLLIQPWDIHLDYAVTEKQLYDFT